MLGQFHEPSNVMIPEQQTIPPTADPLPDGRQLVLASSSPYRKALLARLALPFITCAPQVEEAMEPGETASELVARLAHEKASAVSRGSAALSIGSDQVATLDGRILGKPGNHEQAFAQLSGAMGRTVEFLTGLCLKDSLSGRAQIEVVSYCVTFRALSAEAIERYLAQERPYDCAGSFKSEGLGVALFESERGDDPTALIGLPLIRLVRFLEAEGVSVI